MRTHVIGGGLLAALVLSAPARAQDSTAAPRGRELGGVPAINYDSDEGFG